MVRKTLISLGISDNIKARPPKLAWFTGTLFIPLRKNTVISILGGFSFWDDEIVHTFYL